MFNTHTTRQPKKVNNTVSDKRGVTLVELTIVIALVAVVLTMVVSFSALMSDTAADERAAYAFLEDVSTLKESLSGWVAENDAQGTVFNVSENSISVNDGASFYDVSGMLSDLDEIGSLQFTSNSAGIIKCTANRHANDEGVVADSISFVISLRNAIVEVVS